MQRKLFGTDGIRGEANRGAMTADSCLRIAMAAALQFRRGAHRHTAVIGKDTRLSGYLIEPALTAGLIGVGMDVVLLGPLPTPAVAMLTRSLRADLGIMISASHNPYKDNGLKFFGPDGFKLSDEVEHAIESRLEQPLDSDLAAPEALGRAKRLDDAAGRYIEHVKSTFPRETSLDGLKVVIDCANGAAYKIAPQVLWELGAEVMALGDAPDGLNINRGCGALDPAALSRTVVESRADIGIALDGDADRVVIVDETGAVVDGDQILAVIANGLKARDLLKGEGLVTTTMANSGLERCLEKEGLRTERTAVGDRYVVERMRQCGWSLGGESCGHIVMTDYATTGDGLVAALQVLAERVRQGHSTRALCQQFTPTPQLHRTIPLADSQQNPLQKESVRQAIHDAECSLQGRGRIVLRASGTEPLLRLMVEAESPEPIAQKILAALSG